MAQGHVLTADEVARLRTAEEEQQSARQAIVQEKVAAGQLLSEEELQTLQDAEREELQVRSGSNGM